MATKFAQRIFTAQENHEDELLNQVENDIEIAKEDGVLDTDEYTMTSDGDKVTVFDKINNEITDIEVTDDEYVMSDYSEDGDESSDQDSSYEDLGDIRTETFTSPMSDLIILRIGDYDIEIDTHKKTAKILDEEYDEEFKVNLNAPIKSLLKDLQDQIDIITSSRSFTRTRHKMYNRKRATTIDPRNFSRMSENVRRHFLK